MTDKKRIKSLNERILQQEIEDSGGNMNLDDHRDAAELNLTINNYLMAEFVAIPSNFDINSHLSMRENFGIFDAAEINLEQVVVMAEAIKCSAAFTTMNNALIDPKSCFFLLQVFDELGLVMKKLDNPLRRGSRGEEYKSFIQRLGNDFTYISGQEAKRISLLIINVIPLYQQNIIDEAWGVIEGLKKYQQEVDEMNIQLDY